LLVAEHSIDEFVDFSIAQKLSTPSPTRTRYEPLTSHSKSRTCYVRSLSPPEPRATNGPRSPRRWKRLRRQCRQPDMPSGGARGPTATAGTGHRMAVAVAGGCRTGLVAGNAVGSTRSKT
jgi:hypothetical protein